jgi:hypothetical protein
MKLFCETHNVVICRDCTIKDHTERLGCHVDFILDIVTKKRELLRALLGKLGALADLIDGRVEANKLTVASVHKRRDEVAAEISEAEEAAVAAVRARCAALRSEVSAAADAALEKEEVKAIIAEAEAAAKQAKSLRTSCKVILEGDDIDFVGSSLGFEKDVAHLLSLAGDQLTIPTPTLEINLDVFAIAAALEEHFQSVVVSEVGQFNNALF